MHVLFLQARLKSGLAWNVPIYVMEKLENKLYEQ